MFSASQEPFDEIRVFRFDLRKVNNHSLYGKWLSKEETPRFVLQYKTKAAFNTDGLSRICVKGAKHFPLQISSASCVDELKIAWDYVKQLEEVIPKDIDYRGVELWMTNHIKELQAREQQQEFDDDELFGIEDYMEDEGTTGGNRSASSTALEAQQQQQGKGGPMSVGSGISNPQRVSPLVSTPTASTSTHEGFAARSVEGSTTAPTTTPAGNTNNNGISIAAAPVASFQRRFLNNFFLRAKRPQTKEEWVKYDEAIQQAKRNRSIAIMVFFALYTLLMRIMSFDGYLFLLALLEIFLFYITTQYKEIAIYFARRGAQNRVNRVKDWWYFGLTRHDERKGE